MCAIQNLACRAGLDAAGVAGVTIVGLVPTLIAGQLNLFSVNNNYVIATIHVRRIHRLVLATEPQGDN